MPVVVSGTVIGGVVAGLSGLAGTFYTLSHQSMVQRDNWLSQLDHLTSRITIEEEGNDADNQRRSKRVFSEIYPRVEDHLADAPFRMSDEVRNKQDELADLKIRIEATSPPEDRLALDLTKCENLTNEIYSEAESSAPDYLWERLGI